MEEKIVKKKTNSKDTTIQAIIRQLVSDIQGAPYPYTISSELYTIWYEHAQLIAVQALEYLNESGLEDKDKK